MCVYPQARRQVIFVKTEHWFCITVCFLLKKSSELYSITLLIERYWHGKFKHTKLLVRSYKMNPSIISLSSTEESESSHRLILHLYGHHVNLLAICLSLCLKCSQQVVWYSFTIGCEKEPEMQPKDSDLVSIF